MFFRYPVHMLQRDFKVLATTISRAPLKRTRLAADFDINLVVPCRAYVNLSLYSMFAACLLTEVR